MQHRVSEHVNKRGGEARASVIMPPGEKGGRMVNINGRRDERLLSVSLSAGCRPLLRPWESRDMPSRTSFNGRRVP